MKPTWDEYFTKIAKLVASKPLTKSLEGEENRDYFTLFNSPIWRSDKR
jgi:hypothetical protein